MAQVGQKTKAYWQYIGRRRVESVRKGIVLNFIILIPAVFGWILMENSTFWVNAIVGKSGKVGWHNLHG